MAELIAESPTDFEPGAAYVEVFGLTRPGQVYRMPTVELEEFVTELRADRDFYEILHSGLDNCPRCGRRIKDFDDNGMEADDGQRWCRTHFRPRFGLPYAAPVVDEHGYGVQCPLCPVICRREGRNEDEITKGALAEYQEHFGDHHAAGRMRA